MAHRLFEENILAVLITKTTCLNFTKVSIAQTVHVKAMGKYLDFCVT